MTCVSSLKRRIEMNANATPTTPKRLTLVSQTRFQLQVGWLVVDEDAPYCNQPHLLALFYMILTTPAYTVTDAAIRTPC